MARGKKTGGGSRKGKPNKSKSEVRELIDTVLKEKGGSKWIFEKLVELGEGIEMGEFKDGETRVYSREPNVIALKTLAEYGFGKPAQIVKFGEDNDIESVEVIIKKAK
jgi:hypothetical protein